MLNELEAKLNTTTTQKGANAYKTTESAVLDLFAVGGAFRETPIDVQERLVINAWAENPELTLKSFFYFRDIRGGQGQRCGFYNQLKWLANSHPEVLKPMIKHIPEYGRWDDLYQLFGTPLEEKALKVMRKQFVKDVEAFSINEPISLLAKWLKSENASSKETKRLASITRKYLGLDSKSYRQLLSKMRSALNVVEQKMSSGKWDEIEYGKVPSQAMLNYKTAFFRNDEARMTQYIEDVTNGDEKINAGTLYPYQIVSGILQNRQNNNKEADAMWNALPDYTNGIPENAIAVVDVSGSMSGQPMEVAVSLGIYLAQKATGKYKNKFITFSEKPSMKTLLRNTSIVDNVRQLVRSDWGYSTNVESVFDLILGVAVENELPQSEMLEKLYIISDMEFDAAIRGGSSQKVLMANIKNRFSDAGYEMPALVFWNVASSGKQFPMKMSDHGVQMVSGYSPSILKNLMSSKFLSSTGLMLEVLEDERYAKIKIK